MIFTRSVETNEGICRGDTGGGLVTVSEEAEDICLLGVVISNVNDVFPQMQLSLRLKNTLIREFLFGNRHHWNSKHVDTFSTT